MVPARNVSLSEFVRGRKLERWLPSLAEGSRKFRVVYVIVAADAVVVAFLLSSSSSAFSNVKSIQLD